MVMAFLTRLTRRGDLLALLLGVAPSAALAAAPVSLSQIAIDHVKDLSAIKLTSVGDRTLVTVPAPAGDDKGAFWYGIDPGMDAQTARVVWTTRLACPVAAAQGEIVATTNAVLCRTDHDVFALAPQDGSVRWRFHHKKRLTLLASAGQRVAVNVDNDELTVLDLSNGRVLRRFALEGAPLQAAALSPNGPLAFVVAHLADSAANGQSHRILAQPLAEAASTTDARIEPLQPLWQAPFGGADYRLVPSQGALVATPVAGVIDAHDLATGKILWAEPVPLLPTLEPLADGLAVGGIRPDGVRWVGLADTRTRITRWRRTWPYGALHGVGVDNGHVVWLGDGGWLVTRATDGQLEASGDLTDASEVTAVQAADHVLTLLVSQGKSGAHWQQVTLNPTQAPPAIAEQPALDWLAPGRRLVFLDFAHGGRDPQTLLPGDGPMQAVAVWPRATADGWAFGHDQPDSDKSARAGSVQVSAAALATSTRVLLRLPPGALTTADASALRLSQASWQTLQQTRRAELTLDGAPLTLHLEGLGASRLQVRDKTGAFRWADVDTQVVANEDGSVRLWLMPFAQSALIVRAELPTRTWALMNVDRQPEPTAAPVTQTKPGKKAGKPHRKK